MRRGGSQPSRLRLPSEFRGLICVGAERTHHVWHQETGWGGETAVFGRTTMLSYPPQADGLNPLHSAHIEDIHPVFTVHRDMGGAATWCRPKQTSKCGAPPSPRPRPALRPPRHRGAGGGAQHCLWGSRARSRLYCQSHMCLKCAEAPTASTGRVYFPHRSKRR